MNASDSKRDLSFSTQIDWDTGRVSTSSMLTPTGDLATVSGMAKLRQWVTKWMLTPRGSTWMSPDYGNPLIDQVRRENGARCLLDMAVEAQQYFRALQAGENKDLPPEDRLAAFEDIHFWFGPKAELQGSCPPAAFITLCCTILAESGERCEFRLPFRFVGASRC